MTKLALFGTITGQITQYINPVECLNFPYGNDQIYYYRDNGGNRFSIFEALSKFYK